jgi:hypothetical protein
MSKEEQPELLTDSEQRNALLSGFFNSRAEPRYRLRRGKTRSAVPIRRRIP